MTRSTMKKLGKWALLVVVLLLVLAGAAYLYLPTLAEKYAREKYPDIQSIDRVTVGWMYVIAEGVVVVKPGLWARAERVSVDDKQILVEGGFVKVDLDTFKRPKGEGGGSGGRTLTLKGLKVEARKGPVVAHLDDAFWEGDLACAETGVFSYEGYVSGGILVRPCWHRDKKLVQVDRIEAKVPIPIPFPFMEDQEQVYLTDVIVDLGQRTLQVETVGLGTTEALPGWQTEMVMLHDLHVSQPTAHSVRLYVHTFLTNHPWLKKPFTDNGGVTQTWSDMMHLTVSIPLEYVQGKSSPEGITIRQGVPNDVEELVWVTEHKGSVVRLKVYPGDWRIVGEEASCRDWWNAIPGGAYFDGLSEMSHEGIKGSLSFEVRIRPKPKLKLKSTCKLACSNPLIARLKKGRFTYMAYNKDNVLFERETGPVTQDWVGIGDLPIHVPDAFVMLEDPGFRHHKGFLRMALFNSLKANLEKGRFVKGGSTITMQLAKNLWLQRYRTLDRKAREVILSGWLEGCFTKAELLELYLNIIEFGPNVYGIGAGAKHHFKKPAQMLALDEAFYLAKILPRPKTAAPPDPELKRTRRFIKRLVTSGYLPEHILPDLGEDDSALDTEGWEVNE